MRHYFYNKAEKNSFNGMIVHVLTLGPSSYSNAIINGEEKEITIFDGCFENLLSDHNYVPCIGIIVGHHELKPNYRFDGEGIVRKDKNRSTNVLGVGFCRKIDISDNEAILTESAVKAFIDNQTVKRSENMDYTQINKTVMDNTQELCCCLTFLKNAIENSIGKEYIVYENDEVNLDSLTPNGKMKIIVSKERTFEAAEKYKGKKICCLDFANNHSVGGSPWYAGAQEESMCRISTLYPCLHAKKNDFYEKHIRDYEMGLLDEMGNDDLIYIPDVVVFKTDESIPKLKDEKTWFKTDVIVSAAPQLNQYYDALRFRKIMESRIKRILDIASKEKNEVLILGAFGCGAFNNPPEIVSDIFANLIGKYDFEIVEFAVYCRTHTTNFEIFKQRIISSL